MFRIGITGGIGSGKSTVCRLFAEHGVPRYDCDREAKRLMVEDEALRKAIRSRFGEACYDAAGALNRPYLARRVFGSPAELAALDALVHPAVFADFERWAEAQTAPYVLVESAILFEAGLDRRVDRTVAVLAPAALRLERAVRRDGADPEAIRRRMAAQTDDDTLRGRADFSIVNIREEELAPTVAELDRRFRKLALRHED